LRIVIQCGGRFSSYDQAAAATQHGVLARFVTSRFDKRDRRIPLNLVRSLDLPSYLRYGLRRLPVLNRLLPYHYVCDTLFDRLALRYVEPCDVFHGWNNYCLSSLERARQVGAAIIVHRGSAHPRTQERILSQEWAAHGIRRSPVSRLMIERQESEYRAADYVMVPSAFAYRSMIEEGIPRARLLLLPYGANLSAFVPERKPDRTFRVLFAGMLSFQKGVHYLLEAWRQLGLPDSELVLVGTIRPSFRSTLARYANQATYLGWVDYWQMHAQYARASVFVLPSLQEGSAKVVYEAMACARPVLVTTHCGAIARDGVDGFVVPPRDVEALKDRLAYLHRHPERCKQMGQAARERALEYSTERYARELVEIYRRIAGRESLEPWQPAC